MRTLLFTLFFLLCRTLTVLGQNKTDSIEMINWKADIEKWKAEQIKKRDLEKMKAQVSIKHKATYCSDKPRSGFLRWMDSIKNSSDNRIWRRNKGYKF